MADMQEDEWEYEYDDKEEEVFLVDLDLTTTNIAIKPRASGKRKAPLANPNALNAKKQKKKVQFTDQVQPDANSKASTKAVTPVDGIDDQGNTAGIIQNSQQNLGDKSKTPERSSVDSVPLRFLDMHTSNPLVSYQGQIYSCSWYDTLGTSMFFTNSSETALYEPEISTKDYDMIGMSRIKLVGSRAKIKPKEPTTANETVQHTVTPMSEKKPVPKGKSLGSIRTTNPRLNVNLRKQANFLEQLMNIKRDRGETDMVRLIINNDIIRASEKPQVVSNLLNRKQEIDTLNRKVVKGDGAALERLHDIYMGKDDSDQDADGDSDHEFIVTGTRNAKPILIGSSEDEQFVTEAEPLDTAVLPLDQPIIKPEEVG